MNAFKTQQHRWAKGSIQVGLKLLPKILRSELPRRVKFEAFIHLSNNLAYVLMVLLSIMMPFALRVRVDHGWYEALLLDLPCFMGATVSVCIFYIMSQRAQGGPWLKRVAYLPFVLSLGIGMAVNNAKATIEALLGHESPFVRTPKLAIEGKSAPKRRSTSYRGGRNLLPLFELVLALCYVDAGLYCLDKGLWFAFPFMMLFLVGFLYTGLMSLFQWPSINTSKEETPSRQATAT
jgi:hypothetical protein